MRGRPERKLIDVPQDSQRQKRHHPTVEHVDGPDNLLALPGQHRGDCSSGHIPALADKWEPEDQRIIFT